MSVQCDPPCQRPQLWAQPWQRVQQRVWKCGVWALVISQPSHLRSTNLRSTPRVRKKSPEEMRDFLKLLDAWFRSCHSSSQTESEFRFARWKKAVQRAMNWETTEPCCNANGTCNICLIYKMYDWSKKHNFSWTQSGEQMQESDWDPPWTLSFSFTDNRFLKEDERSLLGGPSHPSPHQSGPLRSDPFTAAACHVPHQ